MNEFLALRAGGTGQQVVARQWENGQPKGGFIKGEYKGDAV